MSKVVVNRKYQRVTKEFVKEFLSEIEQGWSPNYAARLVPGEMKAVKNAFNEFPELKIAYEIYLMKHRRKELLGCYRL